MKQLWEIQRKIDEIKKRVSGGIDNYYNIAKAFVLTPKNDKKFHNF